MVMAPIEGVTRRPKTVSKERIFFIVTESNVELNQISMREFRKSTIFSQAANRFSLSSSQNVAMRDSTDNREGIRLSMAMSESDD